MKLRIKGNSVRLRLGRSEVDRLLAGEAVVETATFDPLGLQRLEYRLEAALGVDAIGAVFEDGRLIVRVPTAHMLAWGRSDEVGMSADQAIGGDGALRILIEKDLECLDAPPEESQADAFARTGGAACGAGSSRAAGDDG